MNELEIYNELLLKSEERIGKTNEIVEKHIVLMDKITNAYVSNIDKLRQSRDNVIKENESLTKTIESLQGENKCLLSMIDKLISSSKSENNINLK